MIEKITQIGKIEIFPDGQIGIRTDTLIVEDGNVIATPQYHRTVLSPSDDVKNLPKLIQDISGLIWTKEITDAWSAKMEGK